MTKHWWNDLGTLAGDIGQIATGHNPNNNPPPVNIPAKPSGVGTTAPGMVPNAPYTGQTMSTNTNDPSGNWDGDPNGGDVVPTDSSGGGGVDWGAFGSAILQGGAAAMTWLRDHPTDAINILSAYSQYQRQGKADNFANQGLALATSEYNDPTGKAALRAAGTAGMLNPKANTPDLSNLQTLAGSGSGNPFTKPLPLAPLNHPSTTSTTPGSTPGSTTGGWMGGIGQVVGKTVPPPLTGLPLGTTLPQGPNGPPPTIPVGMKPPPGWTPPKALPLADPNAPKVA